MKRPSAIAALLPAFVLSFGAAAVAQQSFEKPRFSLLNGGELLWVWPDDEAASVDLLLPGVSHALDPGILFLAATPGDERAGRKTGKTRPSDPAGRGPGGLTYRLGDTLTAGLSYRHALLFGTSKGDVLRQSQAGDFDTSRDRDVFKLNMSWDLALTELDLGYRLESARAEPGAPGGYSLLGVLPERDRTMHSLTLGVTRRWGGD